jgi:hypothetical protein
VHNCKSKWLSKPAKNGYLQISFAISAGCKAIKAVWHALFDLKGPEKNLCQSA